MATSFKMPIITVFCVFTIIPASKVLQPLHHGTPSTMMSHFELLLNDDNVHSLLEPPTPAYTSVTVRRAFIVWLYCGQRNEFKHVCNYFHYLEALEDQLAPEARANSRIHEFNLLTNQPPTSYYLNKHFPKFYRESKNNKVNVKQIEEVKLEHCVFNLEGFHELMIHKGETTKEIIKTSVMIQKYCRAHSKSLKKLLSEFQDYVKKTKCTNSVDNISVYIKKQYLKDELVTYNNMPKNFSFLDSVEDLSKIVDDGIVIDDISDEEEQINVESDDNIVKSPNKIRILINEARRKELVHVENLVPNTNKTELVNKECENNEVTKQILISSKVIEDHIRNPCDEVDLINL